MCCVYIYKCILFCQNVFIALPTLFKYSGFKVSGRAVKACAALQALTLMILKQFIFSLQACLLLTYIAPEVSEKFILH